MRKVARRWRKCIEQHNHSCAVHLLIHSAVYYLHTTTTAVCYWARSKKLRVDILANGAFLWFFHQSTLISKSKNLQLWTSYKFRFISEKKISNFFFTNSTRFCMKSKVVALRILRWNYLDEKFTKPHRLWEKSTSTQITPQITPH